MSPVPTTMTRRILAGSAAVAVAVAVSVVGATAAHAAAAPTITAIDPATGPDTGGTVVDVTGTGFSDSDTDVTASVSVIASDGTSYAANYTYDSATEIEVTMPPVPDIGVYAIAFQNDLGETAESSADDFNYTLPEGSAPTLTGPATTTYGKSVVLSGNAAPDDSVDLYSHGPGGSYAKQATVTASSAGTYSFTYVADSDLRYYTAVASANSPIGLTQVSPTIAGATAKVVTKGSRTTISGTAGVGYGAVSVHFHKAGTAASDYSIVRTAPVAPNGTWSYTYAATVDYRFYATSENGLSTATYLYQAR